MRPWKPCIYSKEQGCEIYETRPENPCKVFECAWLQDKHRLPEHMKPSECGAIVLLDRNWRGSKVIRAVPAGKKIPNETLEWLMAYARKQSLPLLFSEFIFENGEFKGKRKVGYGPPSFVREVEMGLGPEDIMMF